MATNKLEVAHFVAHKGPSHVVADRFDVERLRQFACECGRIRARAQTAVLCLPTAFQRYQAIVRSLTPRL